MNEKIKELAFQAEIWNTDGDYDKCEVDLEKFANLLIQECIKEVSQYHSTTIYDGFIPANPTREHYEEWAYIKGSNEGYNDAVKQIADGLKQHFGVKE